MNRFAFAALALTVVVGSVSAAELKGKYIEARTTDVWTGPCFANADMNLSGKNAVLGWKVDQGAFDGADLSGLGVVAVVEASDTLGMDQNGAAKAVLIVDKKANASQRAALIRLAQKQAGALVRNVVGVETAAVDLNLCDCEGGTCATLAAGNARVATRCLDAKHDKVCGNESAFFPPLAAGVKVSAAAATEHAFTGKGLRTTYQDAPRRSAYVGSFEVR